VKKSVFIAGGSSGIGAAAARHASMEGWDVIVGYRTGKDRAENLVAELKRKIGAAAWAVELDLHDSGKINEAASFIEKNCTPPDAVILSAAPAPQLSSFLKTDRTQLMDQFEVSVIGNQQLLAELWKRFFRPKRAGHVIAVSSAAAVAPVWSHMSAYVIAKRALEAVIECAMAELAKDGLRATLLYPDYTDTPMLEAVDPRVLDAARTKRPGGFLKSQEVGQHIVQHLQDSESGRLTPARIYLQKAS
jgi:NAD(P)-dependent dehydrogenase (short-subunit alcohol dehydrogenase family)